MSALSTIAALVMLLAGEARPAEELPSWTDEVETMAHSLGAGGEDVSIVADPDASGGRAVEANRKTGDVTSWHNYRPLPPGEYLARFRLKVSDNKSKQIVFRLLSANSSADRLLRASDFEAAGKYQEFDLPFKLTKPSLSSTPIYDFAGDVTGWADRVEIRTLRLFGDREQLQMLGYKPPKFTLPADASGVLLVRGLYHEFWHASDALSALGPQVSCTVRSGPVEPTLSGFPDSLEALGRYRLVVLADVPANAFTIQQRAMLEAFVQSGGGLLVFGGPYALGLGNYHQSEIFADLLPVVVDKRYDLIKCQPAQSWEIAKAWQTDQPAGNEPPLVVYRHRLRPKDSAEIVATAGGEPLIVAGQSGRGRVVAVLATPLGEVPPGQTAWWDWTGWPLLLTRIGSWAAATPQN